MTTIFWHFFFRLALVLLGGKFIFEIIKFILGFDPVPELAQLVTKAPSDAWLELGRWTSLGIPALIVLGIIEWGRTEVLALCRATSAASAAKTLFPGGVPPASRCSRNRLSLAS
jgi:hypothetical protein